MQTPTMVNIMTPEMATNPYPTYSELRARSPIQCVRALPGSAASITKPILSWMLLRHADVTAALKDPETFSSESYKVLTVLPRLTLLHDDPPRHTHLRRIVSKAFTPKRVVELEPWIASLSRSMLDALGAGPVELMSGICAPLPITVIATMLGIDQDHYDQFRAWSDAVTGYIGVSAAERGARLQALAEYLRVLLAERRTSGLRDDLLSALIEAEVDGLTLQDQEIIPLCILLIVAGNDTTTALLGNALNLLAHRPALWSQARDDRSLIGLIIEETLRYESPVQRLTRLTTREVELSGVTIPEGQIVDICFGAANRDPAVFEDADEFRPGRPGLEHIAFGVGAHYCIGATLARTEARIVLDQMLDRYRSIAPGDEPPTRQNVGAAIFSYRKLPLVLTPA